MKFHTALFVLGQERDKRNDKFIISESGDSLFSLFITLLSGFQTKPMSINLYIIVLANAYCYN
jgi:hypothetical protein